jgi:hypothetical protein
VPADEVAEAQPRLALRQPLRVRWLSAQKVSTSGACSTIGCSKCSSNSRACALRPMGSSMRTDTMFRLPLDDEMGHFFGLMAHSRRCVDVMSYYDNGQGERCFTRAGRPLPTRGDDRALLPTACDIARCRAVNAGVLAATAPRQP